MEQPRARLHRDCQARARDIPAANQLLLLSAATSLKRIADALEHDPAATTLNIRDLLSGIEMNTRSNNA
jgi:hypothetical protein